MCSVSSPFVVQINVCDLCLCCQMALDVMRAYMKSVLVYCSVDGFICPSLRTQLLAVLCGLV